MHSGQILRLGHNSRLEDHHGVTGDEFCERIRFSVLRHFPDALLKTYDRIDDVECSDRFRFPFFLGPAVEFDHRPIYTRTEA